MLGLKILEERESKFNGNIKVVRSLGLGRYIQVNNLTQSGGVVKTVWQFTLKKLRKQKIRNVLILGLGGGTNALLVRKFWPQAKITGVEIDPVFIELGKKYLGLEEVEIEIKMGDAFDFVKKEKQKYDLILVDTYVGDEFPAKFEKDEFLKLVKLLLTKNGKAVFNRLYYGEKRPLAMKFLAKLEKVFPKVEAVYPQANIMFLCSLVK